MQQYFVNEKLEYNKTISLNEDIVFHLTKVLRNSEKTFRLVDSSQDIYLAELINTNAHILSKTNENNELSIDVTALISVIKQDKFEIILQKLTELGVNKIVPVITAYSQSINFSDNKLNRFNKIIKEAAEQSHRNRIPELCPMINFNEILKYKSDLNLIPYEKETESNLSLKASSITYIIGPEGGFKKDEVDYLCSNGFKSLSLGKTILRAETAAITLMSDIKWENK